MHNSCRAPAARGFTRFIPCALRAAQVAGIISVFGLAAGCTKKPATAPPQTISVVASVPVERKVQPYEDFPGRAEPIERVEIKARVTGYLAKVHFREGAEVKAGDLLYTIDAREYKAALESASAALQQAEARAARARSEFERAKRLVNDTAISAQDLDRFASALQEEEASIRLQQAAVDKAKLNVEFSEIRAPISGRISRTNVTEGNLIEEESDDPLTTIVQQRPIYVYFDAPERVILRWQAVARELQSGDPETATTVLAGLANESGFPLQGRLDFTDNEINRGTGTLRMRALFPNEDRRLQPGMYVRVRVMLNEPQPALLVPDRALGVDQGQRFLYIVNAESRIEYRKVVPGQEFDGLRVISEGLKAGERVVTEGIQTLRPGMTVSVADAAKPAASSTAAMEQNPALPGGKS